MFDSTSSYESSNGINWNAYAGPERRAGPSVHTSECMEATLDEIDFGILLLDADGGVIHINSAARLELDATHPLELWATGWRARRSQDQGVLKQAITAAALRGLRGHLMLGDAPNRAVVSVVPLKVGADRTMVLVMLGKRGGRDALKLQSFAALHRLTPAEAQVLSQLCEGITPVQIATASGLAVSTIRTQIASIRIKTETATIRGLMQKVWALPPLVCVLGRLRNHDAVRNPSRESVGHAPLI